MGEIRDFPFVQAPDDRTINDGFRLLEELGAVNRSNGKLLLTSLGKQLARLPIDPRYARMVVEAAKLDSLNEVLIITAGLSIQDPRERPQDKRQAADEKHSEYANKKGKSKISSSFLLSTSVIPNGTFGAFYRGSD